MGRSQRHKEIIQNTDSSGKGLSEKQPATRYLNQYLNSQAFSNFTGPAGGPLAGSTMAGFPPTLIPLPGLDAQTAAEINPTGDFSDPGQFNLSGNPIYQSLPETNEPGPTPDAPPVLNSLTPAEVEVGAADTLVTLDGDNFTAESEVLWDGEPGGSTFVDANTITMTVQPSLFTSAYGLLVSVRNPDGQESSRLTFDFVEPAAPLAGRTFPIGPFDIARVTSDGASLSFTVPDGSDVQAGDSITIEATGNTSVNGTYTVESVDGGVVVVTSDVALANPIEAHGRLTVTAGA